MAVNTGFSNVDDSGRSDELVDYLGLLAQRLAPVRELGYAQMRLARGAAVLDVGCGAGEVCVELAARVGAGGRVAGVDLSQAMLDAAQRAATRAGCKVELRVASATALPFADASFDAVRAERVFQHLSDPEAALREMIRVTRPGGRIVLFDPDHGQASLALDEPCHRATFEAARRALLRMIVNPHSGVRLSAMMKRAGLTEVEQEVRLLEVAFPDFARAFFLHDQLANAVAAGEVTREASQEFLAALEARHRAGEFYANAIGYTVSGTRAA
jgi:ubiquinone/menaquinone biosynthesis C-methylase UbiE